MAEKKPTKAHPPKRRQHRRLTETHRDSPRLTETHRDSPRLHRGSAEGCHRDSPRLTETHRDSPRLTETVWDLLDGFSFFCCCFWGWQGFLLSFVSVSGLICHCLGRLGLKSLCFCHLKQSSQQRHQELWCLFLPCTFRDILARIKQQS